MNKKNKLNLEMLEKWAVNNGYVKDSYGHFKKDKQDKDDKMTRLKIQKNTVRLEARVIDNHYGNRWVRLRSGYIKDLYLTEDGKLGGLKR